MAVPRIGMHVLFTIPTMGMPDPDNPTVWAGTITAVKTQACMPNQPEECGYDVDIQVTYRDGVGYNLHVPYTDGDMGTQAASGHWGWPGY